MEKYMNIIILTASFITALGIISKVVKSTIEKILNPMNGKIDKIDLDNCKNFLVDFLADVEKGTSKDEVQIERAYEVYGHYTKDLNGNSYIHSKWERLMEGR